MRQFHQTTIVSAVAAALSAMAGAALAAGAGPAYFGGGATLPAIAYVGAPATTLTNPINAPAYNLNSGGQISAFGYFNKVVAANINNTVTSYCQTGSGTGKRIFYGATNTQPAAGIAATNASAACVLSTTTPATTVRGFSAAGTQKFADFAASDSPLSLTEYNFFKTNSATAGSNIAGRQQPVQLPAVVGSIALLYNNADVGTAKLNLTPAQVCGIFSGQITNWKTLKSTLPSKPITVVYRSDGSGTTFSFSNYLSSVNASGQRNVCTGAGQTFALDQTFTKVFPGGAIPATVTNFVGAAGNPGVTAKIAGDATTAATDGAIGYVEAANALAAANKSLADGINFATINSKDPIANLPQSAAAIPAAALVKDKAIGDYVVNGRPPLVAVTPGGAAGCTLLADPSKYSLSTAGYPIIAVSYLLFSAKGNTAATVADLRNLGQFLTKAATYGGTAPVNTIDKATTTTSVVGKTGYGSLPLTTGTGTIATTIQTAATTCIGT